MLTSRRLDSTAGVCRSGLASVKQTRSATAGQWEEKEMNLRKKREDGFTLIELLIAIVVVGILAAVAIVGIGGLTTTANTSGCIASKDAATTAAAAYYANNTQVWPTTFTAMTGSTPALYSPPASATVTAGTVVQGGWTLTIGGGGANPTTFVCS